MPYRASSGGQKREGMKRIREEFAGLSMKPIGRQLAAISMKPTSGHLPGIGMKPIIGRLRSIVILLILGVGAAGQTPAPVFKAGVGRRDITPKEPLPMWGYGAR